MPRATIMFQIMSKVVSFFGLKIGTFFHLWFSLFWLPKVGMMMPTLLFSSIIDICFNLSSKPICRLRSRTR